MRESLSLTQAATRDSSSKPPLRKCQSWLGNIKVYVRRGDEGGKTEGGEANPFGSSLISASNGWVTSGE